MEKFQKFSILFSVVLLPLNRKQLTPGFSAHSEADFEAVFVSKMVKIYKIFESLPLLTNFNSLYGVTAIPNLWVTASVEVNKKFAYF